MTRVIDRRQFMAFGASALALPQSLRAAAAREITWDDLIPPGVPYSEIIGDGEINTDADTWRPIFDENGIKLNDTLDGAYVRLPGYIIPLETGASGVSDFILVPYVGACIHVPPPPPNQLVLVHADTPWKSADLWEAVWVIGRLSTQLFATEIAETGYALRADKIEVYEW